MGIIACNRIHCKSFHIFYKRSCAYCIRFAFHTIPYHYIQYNRYSGAKQQQPKKKSYILKLMTIIFLDARSISVSFEQLFSVYICFLFAEHSSIYAWIANIAKYGKKHEPWHYRALFFSLSFWSLGMCPREAARKKIMNYLHRYILVAARIRKS